MIINKQIIKITSKRRERALFAAQRNASQKFFVDISKTIKNFFCHKNIRIVANFRPIPLHFVVFSGYAVKVADILTQKGIEMWKIRSKKPKKP